MERSAVERDGRCQDEGDSLLGIRDGSPDSVLGSLAGLAQRIVPRVKVLPILDDDGMTNCTDANRSVDIPSASSSEHSYASGAYHTGERASAPPP